MLNYNNTDLEILESIFKKINTLGKDIKNTISRDDICLLLSDLNKVIMKVRS